MTQNPGVPSGEDAAGKMAAGQSGTAGQHAAAMR